MTKQIKLYKWNHPESPQSNELTFLLVVTGKVIAKAIHLPMWPSRENHYEWIPMSYDFNNPYCFWNGTYSNNLKAEPKISDRLEFLLYTGKSLEETIERLEQGMIKW